MLQTPTMVYRSTIQVVLPSESIYVLRRQRAFLLIHSHLILSGPSWKEWMRVPTWTCVTESNQTQYRPTAWQPRTTISARHLVTTSRSALHHWQTSIGAPGGAVTSHTDLARELNSLVRPRSSTTEKNAVRSNTRVRVAGRQSSQRQDWFLSQNNNPRYTLVGLLCSQSSWPNMLLPQK